MKKLIVLAFVLFPFFAGAESWDFRYTTPEPATVDEDGALFKRIVIDLNSNSFVVIFDRYSLSDGVIKRNESVTVYNIPDDPESITANCTGVGEPWPLCTGSGTCTNDCDESTTEWTDVANYSIQTGDSGTNLINLLRNKLSPKVKAKANLPAGALQ
jgi:hypothetical protein